MQPPKTSHRARLWLFVVYGLLVRSAPAASSETPVPDPAISLKTGLAGQEVYIHFYMNGQYVYLKEYGVSFVGAEGDTIEAAGARASKLIKAASYCDERFWLTYSDSMEERIFHDRDFVTVECHLFPANVHPGLILEDLLGAILARPVSVNFNKDNISISWMDGSDLNLVPPDSVDVFEKGDQRAIYYKSKSDELEIVVGTATWPDRYISIRDHIAPDISSPVISSEEFTKLRGRKFPILEEE